MAGLQPGLSSDPDRIALPSRVPLPARTRTAELAEDATAALALAIDGLPTRQERRGPIDLDPERIGASYRSAALFRRDGEPPSVWDPLSGFFRARDGWVRTHANYPWHAESLARTLGLSGTRTRDAAAEAIADWPARELERAAFAAGGLAVAVRTAASWAAERGRAWPPPAIRLRPVGDARPWSGGTAAAPLAGLRVLDFTRVIAGPVGTRVLASLGADVLRVDAPHRPEPLWQWLDTGEGKRSALLDLASADGRRILTELLAGADVVVTGARPGALARFGLEPEQLAERRPELIHARVRAWGADPDRATHPGGDGASPWSDRRGFDSLVQAATGIAVAEGSGGRAAASGADVTPGTLPAQALDHSAGALLAAGIIALLGAGRGGTVEATLEGFAGLLLGAPLLAPTELSEIGDPDRLAGPGSVDGPLGTVAIARPAYQAAGVPDPGPWAGRQFGEDRPAWRDGAAGG
ncbi:CoA transferase [Leucobacter sp. CSA2]|uniref:CoA transferase n=1 Tax=Leucobacter edaphi TaxID=2796472 RepID=A0A934QE10_9MICO|nr:CoA transferase [Leucobacter edaphi]MBK0422116.1 CoA transferase [Leucobacter edaphi]